MKNLLVYTFLFAALSSAAQVGKPFPMLKGVTLSEKKIVIPDDCKGKFTIICLAYSKRAEEALHSWMDPMYNKFVAKTGLMDDAYDVNLYFVPMFTGIHQPSENMARKQLQEGTGKEFFGNIICYHGSIHPYKEELNFDEKEFPYFFILDAAGKIVYTTKGFFSDKKMEDISDKIE